VKVEKSSRIAEEIADTSAQFQSLPPSPKAFRTPKESKIQEEKVEQKIEPNQSYVKEKQGTLLSFLNPTP
jgi:hypothetical protein